MVGAAQQLIDGLDHLPLAGGLADMEQLAAEALEQGLQFIEQGRRATGHDGQAACFRPRSASGDRGVDKATASGRDSGGDGLGLLGQAGHCQNHGPALGESL